MPTVLGRKRSVAFFLSEKRRKRSMDETEPCGRYPSGTGPVRQSNGLLRRTSLRVLSALKLGRVISPPQTPPASPSPLTCNPLTAIGSDTPPHHSGPPNHLVLGNVNYCPQMLTPPSTPCTGTMLDGVGKLPPIYGGPRDFHSASTHKSTGDLRSSSKPRSPATPILSHALFETPEQPGAQDWTQPTPKSSQYDSAGWSSLKSSTAKTTPISSGSGDSSGTVLRRGITLRHISTAGSNALEQIEEFRYPEWPDDEHTDPTLRPGIRTVELTGAVKVFIEREYRRATFESTRAHRQLLFEQKLKREALSGTSAARATLQYQSSESIHLRRMRSVRSKTLSNKKGVRSSMADFDVLRVLGKGSFGVVHLVRKKKSRGHSLHGTRSRSFSSTAESSSADEPMSPKSSKKPTQVFALKVIRKSAMLSAAQEGHLRAERDFLALAESSEWVVPLEAAFQDNTNLYLVLDYMIGGDFLGLLFREEVIGEKDAAFYIAEMILCIEESHRLGWIHRDVKPDNFLIDERGHLKISDFGLSFDGDWSHNQFYYSKQRYDAAKALNLHIAGDSYDVAEVELGAHHGERDRTNDTESAYYPRVEPILQFMDRVGRRRYANSVVGTSQYMAPEVIRGDYYDGRCDWWSIGIILYECLYGRTPFYCESRHETKSRILKHRKTLAFPQQERINRPRTEQERVLADVTSTAVDLMCRLLVEKQDRLSTSRYEANDRATMKSDGKYAPFQQTHAAENLDDWLHTSHSQFSSRSSGGPIATSCVYTDDARDIKRHPFFSKWNIDFAKIHRHPPPYPIKMGEDDFIDKYFDDETEIIGEIDAEIDQSSDDGDLVGSLNPPRLPSRIRKGKAPESTLCPSAATGRADLITTGPDKKRPRDKILRDPTMGETAMALRKRRAFLGYTYRRPRIQYPKTVRGATDNLRELIRGRSTGAFHQSTIKWTQDVLSMSQNERRDVLDLGLAAPLPEREAVANR